MLVIPRLVRRTLIEIERRALAGADQLASTIGALGRGQDRTPELERATAALERLTRAYDEQRTACEERLKEYDERIRRLEDALTLQEDGLADVRGQIDSLVNELNRRLLPTIDERMDETERDLARLVTNQMQARGESIKRDTRLEVAEQRLSDVRAKMAQLEQRTGLWRELHARMTELGDDVDRLRDQLGGSRPASEQPGNSSLTTI